MLQKLYSQFSVEYLIILHVFLLLILHALQYAPTLSSVANVILELYLYYLYTEYQLYTPLNR